MQAQVIAALISAGASITTSLFQKWSGPKAADETGGDEFVKKHYDEFKALVDRNSVVVLKCMEDGQNRSGRDIRKSVSPSVSQLTRDEQDIFDEEFEYRLKYLELTGLLTRPSHEYFITNAGMAFLAEARTRRDYFKELFS